ncbi:MAG TPA: hypothetical protein VFV00_20195, partial [Acidimicrobiales bacterium]|nr:hypothetical protein [Acidimicrobiales bacterium]
MAQRHATDGWFWAGLVIGIGVIAVGLRGLLHDQAATQPHDLVKWLLGAGVVHDAVLAPLVMAAAWGTGRVVPSRLRTPVRLGLIATAMLTVLVWPLVRGWGRRAANPSALPLDYGRNLVAVLGAVWCVVLLTIAVRVWRARR